MPVLELSVDEVLTTTRAARRRLDFDRPVQPEVVRECLAIALQAPTPGGMENWHFVVVADEGKRRALGDIYRRAAAATRQEEMLREAIDRAPSADDASRLERHAERCATSRRTSTARRSMSSRASKAASRHCRGWCRRRCGEGFGLRPGASCWLRGPEASARCSPPSTSSWRRKQPRSWASPSRR